ncbi:hypothetical protein [Paenibacillus sp. OSY-SE]|uniref:hypothetical protein n=1 Tax=Paenibacillus sp. OSY-SE TaxID=1196323 RepID=UPI0002EC3095|nr:hypothetical protein [Paenibacillus sp. OSY-SE]
MGGRPWSRWNVYEYMKYRFERTYQVPTREELETEFVTIESDELNEGIREFELRIGGNHGVSNRCEW